MTNHHEKEELERVLGLAAGSDVVKGPASSTDHGVARWDGTSGDTLLDTPITITDLGVMDNVIAIGGHASFDLSIASDTGRDITLNPGSGQEVNVLNDLNMQGNDILDVAAMPAFLVPSASTGTQTFNNNTTLANLTGLTATVVANTSYFVMGSYAVDQTTSTVPDWKMAAVIPSGTMSITAFAGQQAYRGAFHLTSSGTATSVIQTVTATDLVVQFMGSIAIGGTGGTFAIQGAQNTAHASDTIVQAGGCLTILKI